MDLGFVNIFHEIRKILGKSSTVSSRINEIVGSENIAEHFTGIYKNLYNRVDNGQMLDVVEDDIKKEIEKSSKLELDRR